MNAGGSWSLRRRLLLWLVIPLLVLCGFLLIQAFFSARAAADRAYDRLLQASALAIADRVTLLDDVVDLVHDQLPPDIGDVRRYQTLQALVNCTRRSLLPNPEVKDEDRAAWADELRRLEARGIS